MEKQICGRALVFVGIKHCGKSTQGKRIASHLGLEFFDTDDLILKYEGISPREIYAKFGKEKFMEAEKNAKFVPRQMIWDIVCCSSMSVRLQTERKTRC
ncbi:MAG: hypothetical protein K2J68_08415 [Treponemataceae bacterium]|nr:hypothetical protein [Treponemataceae bacterium]